MDQETDKKLDAILDAIKGLDARITKIEAGGTAADDSKSVGQEKSKKKIAIREFLLENPPPDHIRRTLAVGYFLEKHEGTSSFTRADLLRGYNDAKEPAPSNLGVNIAHCIKDGYMMKAREKKDGKPAYVLTASGERFVEGRYQKAGGK
jgi:hypothetical protein